MLLSWLITLFKNVLIITLFEDIPAVMKDFFPVTFPLVGDACLLPINHKAKSIDVEATAFSVETVTSVVVTATGIVVAVVWLNLFDVG